MHYYYYYYYLNNDVNPKKKQFQNARKAEMFLILC